MAHHPDDRFFVLTFAVFALAMLLACITVQASYAQSPQASPENEEKEAKLLAIELFFLFIGLVVAGFLLILIWLSRRRKKAMGKK